MTFREVRTKAAEAGEVKRQGGRRKVALFDLDHTLIPIDSDYEWGEFTITMGWCDATEFKRRNVDFFAQYQAGTLDIHEYVRFATQAMRKQGAIKSIAAHARFMNEVVQKSITTQAQSLVQQHRAAGDELVIVTATNEFVTGPIAGIFGVSDLIAVELERNTLGEVTGEIKGIPSFREGKVARVEAWLAARRLSWNDVETTFYTDSLNDLALLERATHPVATNPDQRLRAVAIERGWRILDLF
ncbi:MAG: HAD-IB family hydrolase [Polaromonas sp.]|uniref:HAD family hydrolase n=1 Tax=Polaromonas sp. TaxID=1869339 RepID=UPI0017921543|nr:HAD-IB family hydrolase [Polaromonas sp.]NMM11056.1 HAD-IB family hydrolase [Polaromonas sp.]